LASLGRALKNRRLFVWLSAAALCTLLDDVLAVLMATWTSARFTPALAAPMLLAFSLGGAMGAGMLERVLARRTENTVLLVSSAACLVAVGVWVRTTTSGFALVGCFVVGIFALPLHPLAKSAAFGVLPSRPGLVNGASQAFVVIDLVAPALLAWIAERWGPTIAIECLAVAPAALLTLALARYLSLSRRRRDATRAPVLRRW
jgi:fucose permease